MTVSFFPGLVCCTGMVLGAGGALAEMDDARNGVTTPAAAPARSVSRVVTGPAVVGVYRSTGASGEVEFNNFGNGEPVVLDVVPAPGGADIERSALRVRAMLEVAELLAADRQERESASAARRAAAREERAAMARQGALQEDWLASTRPRFYPGFFSRRGAGHGRTHRSGYGPGWRPVAGPYRDGYRYPEQPGGGPPGADTGERPVTKQKF